MSSLVEFRVLGPLEVLVDDAPVAPSARRQRVLLAALLLRAGEVVSADTLTEAVWNGEAPASAQSVLRVYVTQLRRTLPAGRLVTRPSGYQLVIEDGELDAKRFETLAADGRAALAAGSLRLARTCFKRALALWRGSAFEDLADLAFVRDEAARLDELRLACVEARLEVELRAGRHTEVLADLEQVVAEQPYREHLRCQLMLALYRSGRQSDALACYREGRTILSEQIGIEPGPELRTLERRMLEQDPALELDVALTERTGAAPSVPKPPTPTIGRDAEAAELRHRLLDGGHRLVTLVGPGGIGKTRLAAQTAHALATEFADGAVFVDFAPAADPDQTVAVIGRALGLREDGSASWGELVAEHLRGRELLLVLDNLEHVVDGVAPIATLLDAAPRVTALATSRQVLRLSAEHVLQVRPLETSAALSLLTERAAAAGAHVDATDRIVEDVCARLEGVPLAIELAAPWLRTVSPDELLRLLDSRLSVLAEGPRDATPRHSSMRAAIDWSFGLLSQGAQRLLGRASLFNGEFSTDAMLAVGGEQASVELLGELVDASVVHSARGRHRLLEVVREYAAGLPSADDTGRSLHADYFLRLAEAAETELAGADHGVWLERLETEHDNFRAALDWLGTTPESTRELALAAALARFWYVRGYLSEGLDRLQRAAARAEDGEEATLAKALRTASALALLRGDYPLARSLAERALELYRILGDQVGVVRALSNLGAILHAQGELDVAAETLDECIGACGAVGDDRLMALARNNRGDVALSQGDFSLATDQFAQSLELLRAVDDVANVARALYNLGAVAVEEGRTSEAGEFLLESLELSDRLDDDEDVAWCLIALAAVAASDGSGTNGVSLLGFASTILARLGATMKPFEQRLFDRTRGTLLETVGAAGFEQALEAGSRLQPDDAVSLGVSVARGHGVR